MLDVGGGLGGPARTFASGFGCAVEVLDLTEEFCRAGELLNSRTGSGGSVSFRHGSALAAMARRAARTDARPTAARPPPRIRR